MQKSSSIPLTDFMFGKASRGKIPFSGTFELTPMCNFACRMCYVRKTASEVRTHPRSMMTLEQWSRIAQEAYDAGLLYLLLTGGEPTLWPDFWPLYEKLVRMGILVSINTNGSMLDDTAVERLKALPPRRINITLYGANDETYERLCRVKGVFSKIDQAIMMLKEAGIQVKLNCSLTPWNVCDLEKMVIYAQERELILDIASYMFPPVRRDPTMTGRNERFTPEEAAYYRLKAFRLQYGEERYHNFLENILKGSVPPLGLDDSCVDPLDGKIRCRAGKAAFWITWDGLMTPCGMMPEPAVDMAGRSFAESWAEITKISERMKLSGICMKCPNQELCHSCAAMALTETGEISGVPSYLCETVMELRKQAGQILNNS